MDRELKVGLVGAGMISQYHLTGWREARRGQIVAICDPNEVNARKRASEFGIANVFTDLKSMLAYVDLDAVDIATPVGTHAGLVRLAADSGVHVMCQKPMTPSVTEAVALVDYVGDRVRFMVHENYRFRPHYVAIRKWIAEGRIGIPLQGRLTMRSSGMHPTPGQTPWLIARQPYLAAMPRLLIFETLIHHLDTLRSILGELVVTACETSRLNPDIAGEDTAVIAMRGQNDLIVTLDGTFCAPGYPANVSDRMEIIGDKATVVFDGEALRIVGDEASVLSFKTDGAGEGQECFTASVQDFIDGIVDDRPFFTDRLDNLKTLRLMESCYTVRR